MRTGALTASVGSSSGGNGVSVGVACGVFVGAGVEVGSAVGVFNSPANDSVGFSVAAGGFTGASVGAGAALPQEVIITDRIRMTMIRRIIRSHFRIHAGQQVDSVINDRISPDVRSAICTSILPSTTVLNARVFPSGDQYGVSTYPSIKRVI